MAIPAWARTVWVRRAPLPSTRPRPRPARPSRPPPALRVVAFASSDGQARDTTPITYGAASRPGQTPATMSASASPSPPATVLRPPRLDRRPRPRRPPRSPLLRPQGALRGRCPTTTWTPGSPLASPTRTPRAAPPPTRTRSSSSRRTRRRNAHDGRQASPWRGTRGRRRARPWRRERRRGAAGGSHRRPYFTTGHDFEGADGAEGAEEVPMRVPPFRASPRPAPRCSLAGHRRA